MENLIKKLIKEAAENGKDIEAIVIENKGKKTNIYQKKRKIIFEITEEGVNLSIQGATPSDLIMAEHILAKNISEVLEIDVMEVYNNQKESYKYFAELTEEREDVE